MERALQRIVDLDPGLWKTAKDIAREALGLKSRWRGKGKTGVNLTSVQAQIVLHLLEGDYLKGTSRKQRKLYESNLEVENDLCNTVDVGWLDNGCLLGLYRRYPRRYNL